ncbi:MAG TPA: TQO small subunit DoxD [Rhodopila sp.]|nr:TQO small subunit DoxD [Rhodopila sp.]
MNSPAAPRSAPGDAAAHGWRSAAIALLPVRVIQGFIYWGGGSRRFIYAPDKLDPHAPTWMANKFQSAMPGALLGTDHLIAYLLHHFVLLYAAMILFSAAELLAGAALMAGLLTRLSAAVSMGFSVVLMLMFGWQGATCIDEWTMAACNLAMGATLVLAGGGAYAADNALLRRMPQLAQRSWFRWCAGSLPVPLSGAGVRRLGLALLAGVVAFDVGTYSYYRGSVVTAFHSGPVSPTRHHFTLTDAVPLPDGGVRFHLYLDAGTAEAPAHVMQAALLAADGTVLADWDNAALAALPARAIRNDFAYNRVKAGPYGLVATMGAMATVTLRPPVGHEGSPAHTQATTLRLTDVNGGIFTATLTQNHT